MVKISIAMTTYNGARYLEKQLLSLLSQTRPADEVIILDDCSKDNTAEIISSFINKNNLKNWFFSVNHKNLGFKRNFYEAILKTTGDIIFLCDQDDVWHKEKIEIIENLFKNNKDTLAINTGFNFIDEQDKLIYKPCKEGMANHDLIFRKLTCDELTKISQKEIVWGNISPGCTMSFTKELKDIYLSVTKSIIAHDWELNIIATLKGTLLFYNKPLISYRIHEENTIGLDTTLGKKKLKFYNSYEKRLKILEEQKLWVQYFNNCYESKEKEILEYIRNLNEYLKLRYKCMVKRNILSWAKMWKYKKLLYPVITKEKIIGDLIYALGLKK